MASLREGDRRALRCARLRRRFWKTSRRRPEGLDPPVVGDDFVLVVRAVAYLLHLSILLDAERPHISEKVVNPIEGNKSLTKTTTPNFAFLAFHEHGVVAQGFPSACSSSCWRWVHAGQDLLWESQLSSEGSRAEYRITRSSAIFPAKRRFYGVGDAGFEPATCAV